MKQFIESLLLFQFITGRFSPVVKVKSKPVRAAIFASFWLVVFAYQVFGFVHSK